MPKNPLPKGILASDLKFPSYTEQQNVPWESRSFELWFVASFGWCIPTLLIGKSRRSNNPDRTYATTLDGKTVRVGKGPHVTETLTVYVRDKSLDRLQTFIDMRTQGQGKAGEIRDRISSRRAQGVLERASGKHSWRWDV